MKCLLSAYKGLRSILSLIMRFIIFLVYRIFHPFNDLASAVMKEINNSNKRLRFSII